MTCSSKEALVIRVEQRSRIKQVLPLNNSKEDEILDKAKPFNIPKRSVWDAFKLVKANKGSAGVDQESIADFEQNLSKNLYKLWNRLSSGTYFPPPVKGVAIPKKQGGQRMLGVPTVSDRIAQMVVKLAFEPYVEPHFKEDSYGYRLGCDKLGLTPLKPHHIPHGISRGIPFHIFR